MNCLRCGVEAAAGECEQDRMKRFNWQWDWNCPHCGFIWDSEYRQEGQENKMRYAVPFIPTVKRGNYFTVPWGCLCVINSVEI